MLIISRNTISCENTIYYNVQQYPRIGFIGFYYTLAYIPKKLRWFYWKHIENSPTKEASEYIATFRKWNYTIESCVISENIC